MKILEINNLGKTYHDNKSEIVALKDITFDLNKNEILSIVGPSGCGKSTILSILTNLIDKSNGTFDFNDNNITFGYMLQTDSLFPWKTVFDNCLIGLKLNGLDNLENRKYVLNLLNKYGLREFIHKYPASLSGGMRQRVALIRTLALKPDILLLDEAFSALDYQSRLALSDDVYKIIKEEGLSAIIVTHDIAEAISLSDRIIVLTKRPGTIKNIYNINLTNKSNPTQNRKCKEFSKYYDMIWRDLDVNI